VQDYMRFLIRLPRFPCPWNHYAFYL